MLDKTYLCVCTLHPSFSNVLIFKCDDWMTNSVALSKVIKGVISVSSLSSDITLDSSHNE